MPITKIAIKRFTVELTESQFDRLTDTAERLSRQRGEFVSRSELVRELIDANCKKKPGRKSRGR